ncbi:MAG: hypothetical protein ABH863_03145 [Candidatus Micrarchaeota archaeon]
MNLLPPPDSSEFELQHKLFSYPILAFFALFLLSALVLISGLVDFKATSPLIAPYLGGGLKIAMFLAAIYFIRNGISGLKYGKTMIPFFNKPLIMPDSNSHKLFAIGLIFSAIFPLGVAFDIKEIIKLAEVISKFN